MKVLATVTKDTKAGPATWDFVEKDNGSFAAIKREPQEKLASSQDDLRKLYKKYLSYGFTVVQADA